MRRLFWKIFGWFWGAMILIGLALYFVVLTTRPDPLPAAWRTTAESGLRATGDAAGTEWERGGAAALEESLDKAGERNDSVLWLFDANGQELSGQPLPDPAARGRHGHGDRDGGHHGGPPPGDGLWLFRMGGPQRRPPDAETLEQLRELAERDNQAQYRIFGPRVMVAVPVQSASGRKYVLGTLMQSPEFDRSVSGTRSQVLGGVAALLVSGLVCLGLVRYLTTPLIALRDATQQLAAGNLAARTNAAGRKRRDEVADLGRDFDTMADRIENLVGAQRQLLGDISHELRSPLARLAMALALARRHAESGASAEMAPALDRIARETTRLNALIGQLLELTRLESGDAAAGASIELEQLVHDVVADADFEAENKGRAVKVSGSVPCRVVGSHELLLSAVENVVRNAIRHTAPGTTVEVQLQHESGSALIHVRDHGPGVPEAALEELFRPFYRVEAARDRDTGGVGLGLAITERAIRSHGGTVQAKNAEGGGLEIEMRLPCPGG